MSPGIYILTISLFPITAIIVFAMKYASAYAAARAKIREERDFTAMLAGNTLELSTMNALLMRIAEEQSRQLQTLANVDAVLREVG